MRKSKKINKNYYNFDIQKEYSMYKNVGSEDSEFLTYTQWEEHIDSILEKYIPRTRKNFKHYLNEKKRVEENKLQTIDSIWMPLNIFILTVLLTFVFAFSELASDYNANCTEILNCLYMENIEYFYTESLDTLAQDFDMSVKFYVFFSFVVLGVGLLLYITGKTRRQAILNKKDFYQDVISIIEVNYENQ